MNPMKKPLENTNTWKYQISFLNMSASTMDISAWACWGWTCSWFCKESTAWLRSPHSGRSWTTRTSNRNIVLSELAKIRIAWLCLSMLESEWQSQRRTPLHWFQSWTSLLVGPNRNQNLTLIPFMDMHGPYSKVSKDQIWSNHQAPVFIMCQQRNLIEEATWPLWWTSSL